MKKDIKEAIKEHLYANEFAADPNNPGFVDRFLEHTKAAEWGAEWRINSVWHDTNELPTKSGYLAVLCHNGIMETLHHTAGIGFLEKTLQGYSKWAYIKDLLPNIDEL